MSLGCAHVREFTADPVSCVGTTKRVRKLDIEKNGFSPEQVKKLQLYVDRDIRLSREVERDSTQVQGAKIVVRKDEYFEVVEIPACTPGMAVDVSEKLWHRGGVRSTKVRLDVAFSADRAGLPFDSIGEPNFMLVSVLERTYSGKEKRLVKFRGIDWNLEFGADAQLWLAEEAQQTSSNTREQLEGLTAPNQ